MTPAGRSVTSLHVDSRPTGMMLAIAPGVIVRPTAEWLIVVVGDREPLALDALREKIVAVCVRPTRRADLIEVISELERVPPEEVALIVDELSSAGVLSQSTEPEPDREGASDDPASRNR